MATQEPDMIAAYLRPVAILILAALVAASLGVLASATEPLATPSPTAGTPALHEFYGVTPIPPPMPLDPVVGKRAGSLALAKAVGGPVAKEATR